MNNEQFRRLLIDTPKPQDGGADSNAPARAPRALGARKTSSIPMTPRQIGRKSSVQADFARQLAERNAKANPQKQKFKSAAPKGSKLAAGYTDRTKNRNDEEEDETAKRIKNLEEAMKLGHIEKEMFDKLVQEITGGDIGATHLVKGLDRKLLERVRKGEDVFASANAKEEDEEAEDADFEDKFDALAEEDIGPVERQKVEKRGEKAPPQPVAGVKRNRAAILAELKRQRQEAAEAAAAEHEKKYPTLGTGFRKVSHNTGPRIEVDKQGREVLIVVGADGKEKRKVRKQKPAEPQHEIRHDLDDVARPVHIPEQSEQKPKEEESEDEDIFEGVGSNYNPLADLEGDDDSSEEEGEAKDAESAQQQKEAAEGNFPSDKAQDTSAPSQSANPPPKRNYFTVSKTFAHTNAPETTASSADAAVRAALQKVRTLDASSSLINDPDSEESRLRKRAAELNARDRDMDDMDMGFGASRFDDAEEMEREGEKVKFSEWRGAGAEDDDEEQVGREGKKRKRGPKKKKGDKNSAADVLGAMERQKKEKTLG